MLRKLNDNEIIQIEDFRYHYKNADNELIAEYRIGPQFKEIRWTVEQAHTHLRKKNDFKPKNYHFDYFRND